MGGGRGMNLKARLKTLERQGPWDAADGTYTLEQLCRIIWRRDPNALTSIAGGAYKRFASDFAREEEERVARGVERTAGVSNLQGR